MARIQKKKTAPKKKQQQNAAGLDSSAAAISAAGAESGKSEAVRQAGVPAEKKRKVYAPKKAAAPEQSAIMTLADKYFGNWIQFFREVKVELTKVTWPSKKQTIGSTAVVIVFVFVIAFFLGIVDIGLSNLIRLIL
jgi:preprotein translocase subunit SecE